MTSPSVDPSARVQVLPAPLAAPGQCGICGKAEHERGFVDIQKDFEFYGVLYFCYDCVGDMARVMAFLAPEDFATMRTRVEKQDQELIILREAVLGLENEVDGLLSHAQRITGRANAANVNFGGSPVAGPDTGSGAPVGDGSGAAGAPAGPPGAGTGTKREAAQPVSVEGPNDVHDANATVDDLLGDNS